MTRRGIGLLGVLSSAGAHWPGQEKAPRTLREAGLVGRLGSSGLLAQDHGDLPPARFRPDPGRHPQSLDAVVSVAQAVAGRVEEILKIGQVPFVVGGDCTVELGVISGTLRGREPGAALLRRRRGPVYPRNQPHGYPRFYGGCAHGRTAGGCGEAL
ncbi:MAG: arginase family protein, partial [Actinomycetota bacterium]|nr:arginase family protein [Actinomycetota bacterium]